MLVVAVALAAVTASAVSVSASTAAGDASGEAWSYESEVAARLGDLPPEPDLAAMRLVDLALAPCRNFAS